MVKISLASLEERRFNNEERPQLGVQVLTLADLRRRFGSSSLTDLHRLDFHQITLITAGTGTTVIDFTEHRCRPGTLLHTRPGQVQRLPVGDSADEELDGVLVIFTRSFVDEPSMVAGVGTDAWELVDAELPSIRTIVDQIAQEYRQSREHGDSALLLRHLVAVLLMQIARLSSEPSPSGNARGPLFERFIQELERAYAHTRLARDYAARLGVSPRTLTRMSLLAAGKTAKQVIDGRVILEAKRLLAHTDQPVAALADALGFSEATNFVKFFTSRTGTTPTAFRRGEHSVT